MPFVSYSTSSSSVCVNRNENITFHKQFLFEAINMHFKSLFKIIENAFQYGISSAPGSTTKKELIIGKNAFRIPKRWVDVLGGNKIGFQFKVYFGYCRFCEVISNQMLNLIFEM